MTRGVERVENEPWQSVRLGPFVRKESAEKRLAELEAIGQIRNGAVVEENYTRFGVHQLKVKPYWFIRGEIPLSAEPSDLKEGEARCLWSPNAVVLTKWDAEEARANQIARKGSKPSDVWIKTLPPDDSHDNERYQLWFRESPKENT